MLIFTVYADEDSLPSEKEDNEIRVPSTRSVEQQCKSTIYSRQFGVDESLLPDSAEGIEEGGMVLIKIVPDEQGRFGFNVKGGADLELPVNFLNFIVTVRTKCKSK